MCPLAPTATCARRRALARRNRLAGGTTAARASIITDEALSDELVPVGMGEQLQRVRLLGLVSKILLVRNVAVDPAVRGRGVATDLIETALRWGRRDRALAAVSFDGLEQVTGATSKVQCELPG